MASLFDVGDSSDSEDDVDYVPEAGEVSSDEEDPIPHDDETETNETSKRNRKKNAAKNDTESKEPLSDDSKPVSSVDEKKKADDLFKSFLEEAAAEMKETESQSASSGISCSGSATTSPLVSVSDKASCPSSSLSTPDKIFEFAGETVTVHNDTVKSSIVDSPVASQIKDLKKSPASASPVVPSKKRGLDSVLGLIQNKKSKLTVLQKTQLDWKSFKKEEGLEEDLEQFNRGKGGFIERQRFLERSDLRSYEVERDLRMSKKRNK